MKSHGGTQEAEAGRPLSSRTAIIVRPCLKPSIGSIAPSVKPGTVTRTCHPDARMKEGLGVLLASQSR